MIPLFWVKIGKRQTRRRGFAPHSAVSAFSGMFFCQARGSVLPWPQLPEQLEQPEQPEQPPQEQECLPSRLSRIIL